MCQKLRARRAETQAGNVASQQAEALVAALSAGAEGWPAFAGKEEGVQAKYAARYTDSVWAWHAALEGSRGRQPAGETSSPIKEAWDGLSGAAWEGRGGWATVKRYPASPTDPS